MSDRYKEALDKLVLSDETKNKIVQDTLASIDNDEKIANAYKNSMDSLSLADSLKRQIIQNTASRVGRKNRRILRYASGLAACLLVCAMSLPAMRTLDRYGSVSEPSFTEPDTVVPSPTAQAARFAASNTAAPTTNGSFAPRTDTAASDKIDDALVDAQVTQLPTEMPSAAASGRTYSEHSAASDTTLAAVPTAVPKVSDTHTPVIFEPLNTATPVVVSPAPTAQAADIPDDYDTQIPDYSLTADSGVNSSDYTGVSAYSPPLSEIESIDDAKARLGYSPKTPQYLPEGYEEENILLISDSLLEINYTDGENEMTYRTEQGFEDISGDYSHYEYEDIVNVNGNEVILKTDEDSGTLASWQDESSSYSIDADVVFDRSEAVRIVENVK